MKKRIISFLMTLCLIALMVSAQAFAVDSAEGSTTQYQNVVPAEAAANKAVDLIVNGVQVTDSTGAATANISDATAGWRYDSETNTLTLENAVIDTISSKSAGIYYNGGDLIIKLIGESRIDVRNTYNGDIFTSITPYINAADLYIVGDGSLETSGQIRGYDGILSISGGAVLKVPRLYYDEVSIIESSIVANGTEQAIFGGLNITIKKSNIKVDGNSYGIVTNGTLNIHDSEITINAADGISMKEQPFEIVNSVIDVTSSDTALFALASGTITDSFVKLHSENYSALDIDNEALTIRNSQVLGTSGTGMSNSANESLTDSLYQDNNTVALSGNVTMLQSAQLPSTATLIIPEGSTLTVPENVELSALGGIENNSSIVVNGTIVLPDTMSKDDVLALGITGTGALKFGDAHIDANGSCITHNYIAVSKNETHHYTQVCPVCRTVNEEFFAEHTFADGVCTLCNYACVHTAHNDAGVCDVCQKQRGFSVAVGDSVSYFDDMYEAFGATTTGTEQSPATVKLLTNVTHTTKIFGVVSTGAYVVLDLNGYTLTFTHEDAGIDVVEGSHFTLMDSSDGETGSIVADYTEQYPTGSRLIRVSEQSTMILESGRLVPAIYAAEAILVRETSTLIQNGGVIEGTAFNAVSVYTGSLFTQNGGTIISNGYAVWIEDDGSRYVLEGGTLFLNGNWASGDGGYFDLNEGGAVTVNGGVFDAVGLSGASVPTRYLIARGAYGDYEIIINAATFKKADNAALCITNGCYDGTITIKFKNVVFENGVALYPGATETLGEYLAPGYLYYDENDNVITLTEGMTELTGKITVAECTNHTGGTATCTTLAVCTLCKLEYGTYYHPDDNGDIFCDVCGGLLITEATFPDETFRNYIIANFDTDGDGVLSPEEITAVTEIDISGENSYSYTNISDLTGIAYFTNLVKLNANDTKIASIDVSVFTKLEFLYLNGCYNLKDLDLTANTALMALDVSGTGLTELDLSNNSNAGLLMGENTSVVILEHCGMGYIDMSQFGDTARMTILSGGTLGEDGWLKLDADATKVVYEYDTKSNPQIAAYFYVEIYINSTDIAHIYVANTISKDATHHYTQWCETCHTGNEETTAEHTFVDGVCTSCAYACTHSDADSDCLCDICDVALMHKDENADYLCEVCGSIFDAKAFFDPDLWAYMLRNFDADNNGVLSRTEIASVTSVDIRGLYVTKISGIEHFSNLTEIKCDIDMLWYTMSYDLSISGIDISKVTVQSGAVIGDLNGKTVLLIGDGETTVVGTYALFENSTPIALTMNILEPHTHTYEEVVWPDFVKTPATCSTGTIYYKSCECGRISDETFENVDRNPDKHTGTNDKLVSDNAGHHNVVWSCCDAVVSENVACTPVDADGTCLTAETCICGYVIKAAAAEHDFSGNYLHDADGHWHECADCSATDTKEEHSGIDDGDCRTTVYCDKCRRVLIFPIDHEFDNACDTDCNNPGCEYTRITYHEPLPDDGDCKTPVRCAICQVITTEAKEDHSFDNTCDTTCNNKDCKYTRTITHTPNEDDGDCETAIHCKICDAITTPAKIHSYTNACDTTCNNDGCTHTRVTYHEPLPNDGNCTTPIRCAICQEITTEAKEEHSFDNTCDTTCNNKDCEHTRAITHTPSEDDGDCETAIHCKICDAITTPAKIHSFTNACDTDCNNDGCKHTRTIEHRPEEDDGDCTTDILCAVCDAVTTKGNASHTGGTATCTAKAKCSVCGTAYGNTLAHTPEADDGDCTTDILCSVCDAVTTKGEESHTGGTATCQAKAKCEVCDTEYGEMLEHTFTVPQNDASDHWNKCKNCDAIDLKIMHSGDDDGDCTTAVKCTCGYVLVKAAAGHTGGTATCTAKAKCEVCDTEYGEMLDHTFTVPQNDASDHWNKCKNCDAIDLKIMHSGDDDGDCTTAVKCTCGYVLVKAAAGHTGGTATCTAKAKCEVCDTEYGEMLEHTFTVLQNDGTDHWNKCKDCDAIDTKIKHSGDDDSDCATEVKCSCGWVLIVAKSHRFDNACDTDCNNPGCEHTRPTSHKPAEDDGNCLTEIRCIICNVITTQARDAHTGGTATCTAKAKCEVCDTEYGEMLEHTFTVPQNDASDHWNKCKNCDAIDLKIMHSGDDDGDCTTAVKCTCGYVLVKAAAGHTGGTATCTAKAKCEVCETEYGEFATHGETEIRNAKPASCEESGYTGDTYCKVCGEKLADGEVLAATGHGETEVKDAKQATCTSEGYTGDTYCKACGEKLESGTAIAKTAHTYKDGKCTVCNKNDPNHDLDVPQIGDNALLVPWITLFLVCGCGALTALVVKRRKNSNRQ